MAISSFHTRSSDGSNSAMDANSPRKAKARATAMSWIACWNTAVMNSRSQCFPQPAVWGRIHSPRAMGARVSRMSMRARRRIICTSR